LNACLRRSRRDAARLARAVADDETLRYSHPSWLIAALRRDHPEAWERVLLANNQRPPMSLRVNRLRVSREDYAARLVAHGIGAHAHARAPSALVLEAPCAVETLPGFDAGLVSVQDAAAQLAAGLLDPQPGERV